MPVVKKSEGNARINRIAPSLRAAGLVVPIGDVTPDPMNAMDHPEDNLAGIEESLRRYGQRKPLAVIERDGRKVVMAGNGTLEAARALGWTEIAAAVDDDLDAVEAAGYGVADNSTTKNNRWKVEVLAAIAVLQGDAGQQLIGLSAEDIAVLRANVGDADGEGGQSWEELWQGMPEFKQDDQTSERHVVVHFRSEADYLDFLAILDQTTGDVRQNSLWHPRAEIGRFADKRYAAEEQP